MKPVTLFKSTSGLNNVVKSSRIKYDPASATCELASAVNVDIDVSGGISRRKGLTATSRTESCHSIFCDMGECFFVSGTSLYQLNADYSRTGIRSGLTSGAKMHYERIANTIYYTNGYEIGYIQNGVSHVWQAQPYVGPVTTRVFNSPPIGHLLCYHSSRMYIATQYGLIHSEPFAYSWYDLHANIIPLRSKPRMIKAVVDGMYVGIDEGVIFLKGKDPKEFEYIWVSNSPVVTGTDVKVSSDRFGKSDKISFTTGTTINAVMWTAQDGIYLGKAGGEVTNLTNNKLTYPASNSGCAVYNDNKYITLMN